MDDARVFTADELSAMPVGTLIEVSEMRGHDAGETYLMLHAPNVSGRKAGGAGSGGAGVAYGKHWTDTAGWGLIRVLYIPAVAS